MWDFISAEFSCKKILMHLLGRLSIMRYQAWKKPISLFTMMRSVTTGGLTQIRKCGAFPILRLGRHRHTLFTTKMEIKRRIFQNFLDAKVGDVVIGYESNPVRQIVAIGRVSAEQDGEKIIF